jgi:hypothetical protein
MAKADNTRENSIEFIRQVATDAGFKRGRKLGRAEGKLAVMREVRKAIKECDVVPFVEWGNEKYAAARARVKRLKGKS